MGLEKLKITVKKGEKAKGGVTQIEAHFNPNKIVLSKTVKLQDQKAKGRDVPEQQFGTGEPRTFNVDLLFDTYDTATVPKQKVTIYTDKLDNLTLVTGPQDRPPICELSWGRWVFFDNAWWRNWITNIRFSWKTGRRCARPPNACLRNITII